MGESPSLTPKDLNRLFQRIGFLFDKAKGSHQIFFHSANKLREVVPLHTRDLPTGSFHAIMKQAGIERNELF